VEQFWPDALPAAGLYNSSVFLSCCAVITVVQYPMHLPISA